MIFRKLRIAWSMFCGLACVLLIVLWARSYFKIDYVEWWLSKKAILLTSYDGQLGMVWMNFKTALAAKSHSFSYLILPISEGKKIVYQDGTGQPLQSYLGFQSSLLSASGRWRVFNGVLPYWFLTFACCLGAAMPWWRNLHWHFSIRTLLIATTLVAVVLGVVVYAARSGQ